MKHFATTYIIILTMLFIGTGNAYCATNQFLSNEGGTYKLMKEISDYHGGNILLLAAASSNGSWYLMTTAIQENNTYTGYFGSYQYGTYTSIPEYITVNTVNTSTQESNYYPFEYQAILNEDNSSQSIPHYTVVLKDVNGYVINLKEDKTNTLQLTNNNNPSLCEWCIKKQNEALELLDPTRRSLRFFPSDNKFTNNSGSSYNISYLYKKIYTLKLGSTGYATLYNSKDSYLLPSGLTAYTYKLNDTKLEILTQRTDSIPRGVAVVLKGTPNTDYELEVLAKSCAYGVQAAQGNLLGGTDTEATTTKVSSISEKDCKYFYLTNGKTGFGFRYKAEGGAAFTNGAHKAYLCIPSSVIDSLSSQAKPLEFILPSDDENITPVKATTAEDTPTPSSDNDCYDILGRRIAEPQRGTYIKQGKKYIK